MADPGIPAPYLDPSQYPSYLDLQRKQMLAQALMSTAQQSAQTPPDWNSMRVVPRRAPLQNVAMLASALMAGKAQNTALDAQKSYFQGMYGQPQGSPSVPSSPDPSALPTNAAVPPYLQADAPAGTSPSTPAPAMAQKPPAGNVAPSSNQPMLLPGTDLRTSQALLGMMGPAEYGKALAGQYSPTDLQKTLRAAGVPQSQWAPILMANVQKENYIAPIEEREGSIERDPRTNQVIGENPKTALGAMNLYDTDGLFKGQSLAPGATAAISGSKAAETAGTISQTPMKVGVDAQGRDVYVYPTPPAMAGGPAKALAASGHGGGGGAPGAGSSSQSSTGGGTASPAVISAQEEGGKTGQTYSNELSKNATGATEVRRSLSELKNLAAQATPGAMNEGKMKLGSYMIAAGASPETTARMLGVDIGALQAAAKQTSTLAVSTIHSMTSRGTNFDLETFMRNNPNLNMSDPSSFQKVVDYMDNKAKQEIAKQKDFVQWKKGMSPDDWEAGHTAHWLDQQNSMIDSGQTNSRPPLSSFVRP